MAFPTAVNSQITDSVSQVNTKVLGDAPAIAMGNLFVATSQALSNAAHNATNNQQQSYVTMQASTTQGCPRCMRSTPPPTAWPPAKSWACADVSARRDANHRAPAQGGVTSGP